MKSVVHGMLLGAVLFGVGASVGYLAKSKAQYEIGRKVGQFESYMQIQEEKKSQKPLPVPEEPTGATFEVGEDGSLQESQSEE